MAFPTSYTDDDTAVTTDGSVEDDIRTRRFDMFDENKDLYNTKNYKDAITQDSTDEVDPQSLVRDPSREDIRWIYRDFIGSTLVDKPIDDIFKNGFSVQYDPTNSVRSVLDEYDYIDKYKSVKKKSRRDGFALLFYVCEDTTDGIWQASTRSNFTALEGITVLTCDDLTDREPIDFRQKLPLEYQPQAGQNLRDVIEVRESGIVVSRKDGDVNFGDPIGYIMDRSENNNHAPKFIHESRIQHFTWNTEVDSASPHDHAYSEWGTLGKWEGQSLLRPPYHLLKMLFKSDWALSETMFRYSSPVYELTLRQNDGPDELEKARQQFRNVNAKSDVVLPHGWEMDMHHADGQLDPEQYIDPLIQQVCAATEMTKSVLFGTQAGTVTGSETDITNYTTQVERMRQNETEDEFYSFIKWISIRNPSEVPTFALGYDIDWNALFEPSVLDKSEVLNRHVQTIKMAQENAAIDVNEARDLFSEAIDEAGFETDIEGEMTSEKMNDTLEILVAQQGAMGPESAKRQAETEGGNQQNGGPGREYGSTNAKSQPNRSS